MRPGKNSIHRTAGYVIRASGGVGGRGPRGFFLSRLGLPPVGPATFTLTLALIYTMSMPTPTATIEYMKLSVSERIQLVEDIWDSIAAEAADTVELSQAQKDELHRRVAAHRADPSTAIPWEQVRSKLFPSKP